MLPVIFSKLFSVMCDPLWEIFDTWKMLVNKTCLPSRENLICYRGSLAEFFPRGEVLSLSGKMRVMFFYELI